MESLKHLLRGLGDVKFRTLITPQIVGIVMVLAIVSAVVGYFYNTIDAFHAHPLLGIFYLFVLGPVSAMFSILWYRVILEIAVVLFRILAMRKERSAILQQVASRV